MVGASSVQFTDGNGRVWKIKFTIAIARTLREHHNIRLTDPDSIVQLCADPELQYVAVSVACSEQMDKLGVTSEEFSELFTDHYSQATEAMVEALGNFYQSLTRADLVGIVKNSIRLSRQLVHSATGRIEGPDAAKLAELAIKRSEEAIDNEIKKQIKELEEMTLGTPSGVQPGDLGSTPLI